MFRWSATQSTLRSPASKVLLARMKADTDINVPNMRTLLIDALTQWQTCGQVQTEEFLSYLNLNELVSDPTSRSCIRLILQGNYYDGALGAECMNTEKLNSIFVALFNAYPMREDSAIFDKGVPEGTYQTTFVPVMYNQVRGWYPINGTIAEPLSFTDEGVYLSWALVKPDLLESQKRQLRLRFCSDNGLAKTAITPDPRIISEHIGYQNLVSLLLSRGIMIDSVNTYVLKLMQPLPGRVIDSKPEGRSGRISWRAQANLTALVCIFGLLCPAMAQCVTIQGNSICNLRDYSVYRQSSIRDGPYMVCLGGVCIKRYAIGEDHFADPSGVDHIYPWRCPSWDWRPSCNISMIPECELCKGFYQSGECHMSTARRSRALQTRDTVVTFTNDTDDNLVLNETHAYYADEAVIPSSFKFQDGLIMWNRSMSGFTYSFKISIQIFIGFSLMVLSLVAAMFLAILSRCKKPVDEYEAELLQMGEDTQVITKRIAIPQWAIMLVMLGFVSSLLLCASAEYLTTNDLRTYDEYNFSAFELPSACSCSNPNDIASQLSCVVPCESQLHLNSMDLTIQFGLFTQCDVKYLVVLDRVDQMVMRKCNGGSTSTWLDQNIGSFDYTELISETSTPGYGPYRSEPSSKCGYWCGSGSSVWKLARFTYRLIPAQYCTYLQNPEAGIVGLPVNVAYTATIQSTLLSQATLLKYQELGSNVYLKVTNGQLGSNRAWVVSPDCVSNSGSLNSNCWVWGQMKLHATASMSDCREELKTWPKNLEEFRPLTISEQCQVSLQFENLRCYRAPAIHNATYFINEGITFINITSEGMVAGYYAGKGAMKMPESWKKCDNCTATDSECPSAWKSDELCTFTRWNETNLDDQTTDTYKGVFNNVAKYSTIIIAAVAILVAIIIIIIIACCCRR